MILKKEVQSVVMKMIGAGTFKGEQTMKRYFLSIFAAVFVISSCVQDIKVETEDEFPGDEDVEVVVPESQELSITAGNATKTVLGSDRRIRWESGDTISVVFTHSDPEVAPSVSNDFVTKFEGDPSLTAIFKGTFDSKVSIENGYNDNAYAIYPHTSVNEKGEFVFDLPSIQKAEDGGSFQSGCNLTSAPLLLSDVEDGSASADFLNALVNLRFTLDPAVKEITFKGTAPFAGSHPMEVYFWEEGDDPDRQADHGRLLMVDGDDWTRKSYDVTLKPEGTAESFSGEHLYNLIVWPGSHESLTITLNYGEPYGTFDLVNNFGGKGQTFEPNKFYTIQFPSALDKIMTAVDNKIVVLENSLGVLDDDLGDLEDKVDSLVNQIQSVSMLSEYTDNIIFARYSTFSSDIVKADIEANYLIRPAAAAAALVEMYNESNDIFKGQVLYKSGSGFEVGPILPVTSVFLEGDILTVTMDPAGLKTSVYTEGDVAEVALLIEDDMTGTSILSDYAKILTKSGSAIRMNKSTDIPVLRDSKASLQFDYFVTSDDFELEIVGNGLTGSYSGGSGGRGVFLTVDIPDDDLTGKSLDIVLTCEGEKCVQTVTFVERGYLNISTNGDLDCYGGDVTFSLETSYPSGVRTEITSGSDWLSGLYPLYSAEEYDGDFSRTAEVSFTVTTSPGITCTKKYIVTQYSKWDPEVRTYYNDNDTLHLQTATANVDNKLNLVILGDGYQKKDMAKVDGRFKRDARRAADVFLNAIDEEFRDRFNVYVRMRMSANAGNAEDVDEAASGYTYYQTYKTGGGTNVNISGTGTQRVISDVESICTRASYDFYRTVALLLINVNIDGGSSDYEFNDPISTSDVGDGYANFAYSMIPANTTGFGGLVRHESVGHCLGRLGDEYYVDWYTCNLVTDRHDHGFYSNIALDITEWQDFKDAGYKEDEVGYYYYKNGDSYVTEGNNLIYRSTNDSGIMFDSQQGSFNAVSRWAIYERIRKQTEGPDGDYWNDFLIWDQKNRGN